MITQDVSTLKIHKLTQEQYDRELAAGNIDENALYLTPDEEIDLGGYAEKEHTHEIADVNNLQTVLDGKADVNHGVHVTFSDVAPEMAGVAYVGVATTVARSDHRHPTDTTRAAQTDFELMANRVETVESGLSKYVECSETDILNLFK